MEKTIEVKVEDIKRAFEEANNSTKESLLTLFPQLKEDLQITDRVKTFEDACREVYIEPKLYMSKYEDEPADVTAYMKLRVICKALNEGWEPQFTEGEERWNPVFLLWSKEELSVMSDDQKAKRQTVLMDRYSGDWAGFSHSVSENVIESDVSNCASRLCLKSQQLADYCGKQFVNIWADFFLTKK